MPSGAVAISPIRSGSGCTAVSCANGRSGAGALYQAQRIGLGDRVEHRGAVGDGARDDPLHDRPEPALRKARHATATGLEADQPAVGGGDPDRAAAVVGVSDREHARRPRPRAAPPLEPPGERVGSQGLRVMP